MIAFNPDGQERSTQSQILKYGGVEGYKKEMQRRRNLQRSKYSDYSAEMRRRAMLKKTHKGGRRAASD